MAENLYTISTKELTVQIASKGAELRSIRRKETEYLWQPDAKYWTGQAPNLFPYIARLTKGSYRLEGREYQMDKHGFARKSEFEVVDVQEDCITLRLQDSEDTFRSYPYHFVLDIIYKLEESKVNITFRVENRNERTMYFGIGGHPGFRVPLDEGLTFEDYYLEFGKECQPLRVGFSEDCFVQGEPVPYPLENGKVLPLAHEMFDEDAIVLTGMASQVTLKSDGGRKAVRVTYPDMQYLGFWHMPHTDAPYVCIEPWSSLPSRKDIVEDLAVQPNLAAVKPGEIYENHWCIEVLE